MGPSLVQPLRVRVGLRAMINKVYPTLPRTPDLKHQN